MPIELSPPGLPSCKGSICAFVQDGEMYPKGTLVTESYEEKNIGLLTLGKCPSPVAIAIGGGGYGYNSGGGSGYVEYTTNWPREANLKTKVHPGSARQDSYVRFAISDTDKKFHT